MTSDDLVSVSEELRTAADDIDGYSTVELSLGCTRYLDSDGHLNGIFTSKWFRDLADRIDDEMVELPKDGEGKPIHPGDIEYLIASGDICKIYTIEINGVGAYVTAMVGGGTDHADVVDLEPCKLTHERPDSLERIADELDEMVDAACSVDDSCERLADLADRIRRLAEESIHES